MLKVDQELLNSAVSETINVRLYKNNELLETIQFETDADFSQTFYKLAESDNGYDSYRDRVNPPTGTLESSKCLENFFNDFKISDVGKVVIEREGYNPHTIEVRTISGM